MSRSWMLYPLLLAGLASNTVGAWDDDGVPIRCEHAVEPLLRPKPTHDVESMFADDGEVTTFDTSGQMPLTVCLPGHLPGARTAFDWSLTVPSGLT